MDSLQVLSLALIQGLTEFLPISSSAHLLLAPLIYGVELQNLAFDVALHLGTLAAVLIYFRQEIGAILNALWQSAKARRIVSHQAQLGAMLFLATLPLLVLGLPLKQVLDFLRTQPQLLPLVIAATTLGFGGLLWLADVKGSRHRDEYSLSPWDALIIGCLQAVAIIPGTSRSGITITAGLFLGLSRRAASRFSFLLSIPTILMAGGLESLELARSAQPVDWATLGLGASAAFAVAYGCIYFFLRFIERVGMLPFVLYRLLLGAVLLLLF